jgi:hypothetical protein
MSSFSQWNQALLEYFFAEQNAGQIVRLSVDKDLLDEKFEEYGGEVGFLRAVGSGPEWMQARPTWRRHINELISQWMLPINAKPNGYPIGLVDTQYNRYPCQAPPFLPYLVFSCYVWTCDDQAHELNNNSYYAPFNRLFERCRRLLNQGPVVPNRGNMTAELFQLFCQFFDQLSIWANNNCNEQFGCFHSDPIGNQIHIGRPRSQVLITGKYRRRLGYLFQSLNFDPDNPPKIQVLSSRINDKPDIAKWALGNLIFDHVTNTNNTEYAPAIMSELLLAVNSWDGDVDEYFPLIEGTGTGSFRSARMAVRVCLACHQVNMFQRKWQAFAFVYDEKHTSGYVRLTFQQGDELTDSQYDCQLSNDQYFRKYGEPTKGLKFKELVSRNTTQPLRAIWTKEDDHEGRILPLITFNEKLRFFIPDCTNNINSNSFIREISGPPQEEDGPFLVLVSNTGSSDWANFFGNIPSINKVENFDWDGGLDGTHDIGTLWKVESRQSLDICPDWISVFDVRNSSRVAESFANLNGGTYVRKEKNGIRSYLAIDLPFLSVNTDGDVVNVECCSGGRIEQEPIGNNFNVNIQPSKQFFNIIPDLDQPQNRIELNITKGARSKLIQFWVDRAGYVNTPDSLPKMGKYGNQLCSSDGIEWLSGNSLDSHNQLAINDQLNCVFPPRTSRSSHPIDSQTQRALGYDLMTWINAKGSVPYHKTKNFIEQLRITSGNPFIGNNLDQELKALWALGHLELSKDSYGRLAKAYALPMCLYQLPSRRNDGKLQFVLSGTIDRNKLIALRQDANAWNIEWVSVKQLGGGNDRNAFSFVPHLELLLTHSRESVEEMAEYNDIKCLPDIPALRILNWSACLSEWSSEPDRLVWQHHVPVLENTEIYCPNNCKWTRSWNPNDNNPILRRAVDRKTKIHKEFQLSRPRNDGQLGTEYAKVFDPEWAEWMVLSYHFNDDFAVPYESNTGRLDFPIGLGLPPILEKALVLCSGYAPSVVSRDANQWPWNVGSYGGFNAVKRYHAIPKEIASAVLDKVKAKLSVAPF